MAISRLIKHWVNCDIPHLIIKICILSQSLLDKYLRFVDSERLNDIREGRPV